MSDLNIAVSKAVQDSKGTGYVERMAAKGVDEKNAITRLAAARVQDDDHGAQAGDRRERQQQERSRRRPLLRGREPTSEEKRAIIEYLKSI